MGEDYRSMVIKTPGKQHNFLNCTRKYFLTNNHQQIIIEMVTGMFKRVENIFKMYLLKKKSWFLSFFSVFNPTESELLTGIKRSLPSLSHCTCIKRSLFILGFRKSSVINFEDGRNMPDLLCELHLLCNGEHARLE